MAIDHTTAALLGQRFAELHEEGTFLLVNVVDPATAAAVVDAGALAIATSSAAHAATIGRSDAAGDVTLEEHAVHTELVVAGAPTVPCNVDGENGYGHEPEDVAAAVRRFAATGAAGMGIEDWSGDPDRGVYDRALTTARIEAAVEAASSLDRPFVITGRTEVLLYRLDGGLDEALARLQAMASVGAHCLYAPGTWDLDTVRAVVDGAGGPVNILAPVGARPGLPTAAEIAEAGARRISLGSSLVNAQITHAAAIVGDLLADAQRAV